MGGAFGAGAMFSPKWSGTEWEGVTENTSSPVKAVCEQATFGNRYLVMLSPILLKPAEAVPTRQAAVCLYHCAITGALILRSSTHTNSTANTEQGQAAWWE